MFHYVYRITNLINHKIYVGKRSCKCEPIEDLYMGNGVAIKYAIDKYGVDNFKKEILSIHDTSDDALSAKKMIVTEEFINRDDTYNLMVGGNGGKQSDSVIAEISKTLTGKYVGENSPNYGRKHSDESKLKNSKAHKEYYKHNNHPMSGYRHTYETKEHLRRVHTGMTKHTDEHKQRLSENWKGDNNPMSGGMKSSTKKKLSKIAKNKIWITNGETTKMVTIDEYETIYCDWFRGRKLKHE